MSKNTKWVVLFAIIMLAYGASQFIEQSKSNKFKSPLLTFLPEQVQLIKIHEFGKTPFQLLKLDNKWFLSADNVHEIAQREHVEQLMKLLKAIRTAEIISQNKKDWQEYGLGDKQGTLICIETREQQLPCLRLGLLRFSAEEKTLQTFARIHHEKEIYSINGIGVSSLSTDHNDYRNRQILNISDTLRHILFKTDTSVISVKKWGNYWVDKDLKILDSLKWKNIQNTLSDISLNTFADDVDELSITEKKTVNVHIYTQNDSFLLELFVDSTLTMPYIIHSNQFPKTWMACDSVNFFKIIPISVWRKL